MNEPLKGGAVVIRNQPDPVAFLRTRCGCERHMAVPWPPPEVLFLPLDTWRFVGRALDDLQVEKREFRLQTRNDDCYAAWYEEVA